MGHLRPAYAAFFGAEDGVGLQRTQAGTQELLVDIVNQQSRAANAKQALNQLFNGDGKATGPHQYLGLPVWHASSGNGQKSVCLFYTIQGVTAQIVAVGEHRTSTSYDLEWGRSNGSFRKGATITI